VLWQLNQIALFRYSALTFNAHRIHYDVDYARDVEGYPGLVVHGPLLATLLMGLAVQEGRRLSAFEYLARSPAFLPEPLTTNLREDPGPVAATKLWVAGPDGRVVMEGTATYRERVDS
jgi:3-methylfumaryl-CoA hydratase